jgi:cyclopropane-fatty-acyl-phospholipid synthase
MATRAENFLSGLLDQKADVKVGGNRPWDVKVHDKRLFSRLMTGGTLALGESYMDGWWDTENIDQLIHRLLTADIKGHVPVDFGLWLSTAKSMLLNLQRLRVFEVGEKHYDVGNDLYKRMLDARMIYSCGYWANAENLDQAQEHKLDLICRKVGLEPGMKILDIGSGWGGFLKFAAERYGVEGVGITISREQLALAQEACKGLPVTFRLEDYLDTQGTFDRIISIGMFEHVGYRNYAAYMRKVHELLAEDGIFLLHTIGGNFTQTHGDPWSEKYIFPNGMLPSAKQITTAAEGQFIMEDWHNFGADYDRTLMAWHENFVRTWPEIKDQYDERFYRMWRYYLLSFAAAFRARSIQLWQIVYSKNGVPGGYRSIR